MITISIIKHQILQNSYNADYFVLLSHLSLTEEHTLSLDNII